MPLTPEDVQNKKFTVTRFGQAGYKEEEVDDFLEQVEAELRRLLAENSGLRQRAASGPEPAAAPPPPPPVAPPPAPAPAVAPPRPEEGQEAALRTLLLAQRTADEAVAEARREAEGIVAGARERAAVLEREAHSQHAGRIAALERERAELERAIDSLRGFEREYRTRLKAYLEGQLRDLETRAVAPPTPPAGPGHGTPGHGTPGAGAPGTGGAGGPAAAGRPGGPSPFTSGPAPAPGPGPAPTGSGGPGTGPAPAPGIPVSPGAPTAPPLRPAPPAGRFVEDVTPGADVPGHVPPREPEDGDVDDRRG